MLGLGTAVGYLDLDISKFAAGIDAAAAQMSGLNNKINTVSGAATTVGQTFAKTGTALTMGLTLPIAGAAAASVSFAKDFEYSMARLAAVSGLEQLSEDFDMVKERAVSLSEQTRYTATEVSDAMYYMGLAGWNAQEIYSGIPGVLALGAASGEDLSRVSDIVTDSLTAFGKSAEDVTEFVNVLAQVNRSANTNVDQLGEAFKYVAPVAGSLGYSIQDVSVALGIAANNGVKASQAGTSLRQAFNQLIRPSDKAIEYIKAYDLSLFNADGSSKDFMSIMEDLRFKFKDLAIDIKDANGEVMTGEQIMEFYGHKLPTSDMEKLTAIVNVFGVRALPTMLSIINDTEESFNELRDAVYGANDAYEGMGVAFGMADEMMNTLQGDWWYFTSALGRTRQIVGELINNELRKFLQSLTELVKKFNNLDEAQQQNILRILGIAAAIGPALLIFGKLITTIIKVKDTIGLLGGAFKTLFTAFTQLKILQPLVTSITESMALFQAGFTNFGLMAAAPAAAIGAMVALIATLVAAFVTLWKTNEEFRNNIIGIWNEIKDKFIEAGQKITDAINSLGFDFENIIEVMKSAWLGFCNILAPYFEGVFTMVKTYVSGLVDTFTGVIEVITGIIKGFKDGDWTLLWQGIRDIAKGLFEQISAPISGVLKTITGLFDMLGEKIGVNWLELFNNAKQSVVDFANGIIEWFTNIPNSISNVIEDITQGVESIKEQFLSFGSGLIDNAKETVIGYIDGIKQFVENLITFIDDLPNKIAFAFGYTLAVVTQFVANCILKAAEFGRDFIDSIVNFIVTLPERVQYGFIAFVSFVQMEFANLVLNAAKFSMEFVNGILQYILSLPGKIKETFDIIFISVQTFVTQTIEKGIELGTKFVNGIIEYFVTLPGRILQLFEEIIDGISIFVADMGIKAYEAATKFSTELLNILQELPSKMLDIGANIVSGIWQGITNTWNNLKESVSGLVNSFVSGWRAGFGIHSPSTVMADGVGQYLLPGVVSGIKKSLPKAVKDTQRQLDEYSEDVNVPTLQAEVDMQSTVDYLGQVFLMVADRFVDLKDVFIEAVNDMIISLQDLMNQQQQMINNFKDMSSQYKDLSRSVSGGGGGGSLPGGIMDMWSSGQTVVHHFEDDGKPVFMSDIYAQQGITPQTINNFTFMTDKPIDEVEAKRVLEKSYGDIAEGFVLG